MTFIAVSTGLFLLLALLWNYKDPINLCVKVVFCILSVWGILTINSASMPACITKVDKQIENMVDSQQLPP